MADSHSEAVSTTAGGSGNSGNSSGASSSRSSLSTGAASGAGADVSEERATAVADAALSRKLIELLMKEKDEFSSLLAACQSRCQTLVADTAELSDRTSAAESARALAHARAEAERARAARAEDSRAEASAREVEADSRAKTEIARAERERERARRERARAELAAAELARVLAARRRKEA